jgi:hypothetical protein
MNAQQNPIDPSLINLTGGIFDALPSEVLPLETFRLESYTEPADEAPPVLLQRRRRQDSLAPAAFDAEAEVSSAAPRRSSWAVGLAAAAGVAIALTGAARSSSHPAPAAAAVVPAPAVETPAPVLAAAPAALPAVAQKLVPGPIAVAPRAARVPAARPAASPVPAAVVAPAPVAVAPPGPAVTADFDRSAVSSALSRAGSRAAACRDEAGTVNVPVAVTFAPSGRVMSARVTGGPLVGTPAGGCLASTLRGLTVPAFAGDAVTVNASVRLH